VSLLVLAILGLSPVGNMLIVPLENRFPSWDAARGAPDGIIVLGGVIDASSPGHQIMLNESAERLTVVPDLARRYPNARILFSGGSGALIGDGGAEAGAAARLLESLGISLDRVTLEDRSRNTVENAVYSKLIVHPKRGERWLLVTSAFHMPRAIGVFRKVGFPVEPYPVDWRTRGAEDMMRPFAVMSDGLQRSDTVVLSFCCGSQTARCAFALGANHPSHYLRQFDSRAPVEDCVAFEGSPSEHMISLDRTSEES
jgi:uncharacterized SAM-binding protein YcdF (DUF218 family)